LLSVSLEIKVKLAEGYNNENARQLVFNTITAAIELILLNRSYGDSLRIGDLYAIVEAVEGVVYSNISISKINGEAPKPGVLNEYGDLEIKDYQVITLGDAPVVSQI